MESENEGAGEQPAKRIELSCSLVPPGLPTSTPVDGTVTDEQRIDIGWMGEPELKLAEPLAPGTDVRVVRDGSGGFAAKTMALVEQEQREKERRKQQRQWERERRRIHGRARTRRERESFWSKYDLPDDVVFTTGSNTRLGELQRGSTGTGKTTHTVTHIAPLQTLSEGRLHRDPREFLCQGGGRNKTLRYGPRQIDEVPPLGPDKKVITCQTCLERMERWEK